MYGTIHVVADLDAVPAAALAPPSDVCEPTRVFVRDWTVAELLPLLTAKPDAESWERGQALFTELSCAKCHQLVADVPGVAPDLKDVAYRFALGEFTRTDILEQIILPSAKIDAKYSTTTVLDRNGRIHTGIVQTRNSQEVVLIPSPLERDEPVVIKLEQIEEEHPSEVSLMPQGLLSTLSAAEISDLLLFIETGGEQRASR
jgi:putative heme-binding domain-containing protein